MSETFRVSMNWLHTWAGLVIGAVLFAVFWMGTLSVFDREFDRWMMPETRRPAAASVSLDAVASTIAPLATEKAAFRWAVQLPTERMPTARGYFDTRTERQVFHLAPDTGAIVAEERTLGGTGFFFPFHFGLFIHTWNLGEWLVGLAAIAMMAMCVSGVVIHRRIFIDFFTLRIVRKTQRTTLDLHNVTGVLGLPFNFLISFSGLVIFIGVYLPGVQSVVYPGDPAGFTRDAYGGMKRANIGAPAPLASLDVMSAEARRRWGGDGPVNVLVFNPGDAASYVYFNRSVSRRVTLSGDTIVFDGPSGRVLSGPHRSGPVMTAQSFLSGMHFIQFRHATLRWLYFISGLAGCVLIATGYLFWIQSRAKRHARTGVQGMALVRGLTVGATIGLVIATLGYLIANRALPDVAVILGRSRLSAEVWVFCATWVATFAHAWAWPDRAWRDQSAAAGIAGIAAVALNWITTGETLPASMMAGYRGVAGIDCVLLLGAGIALYAARRLATRS